MATRNKRKLMKDEENTLMSFMKINSFIWDVQSKDYKNTAKKQEKWEELSNLLGKDVGDLKKRWKSIKDYQKRKRNSTITTETTTGNGRVNDDEFDIQWKEESSYCFDYLDTNNPPYPCIANEADETEETDALQEISKDTIAPRKNSEREDKITNFQKMMVLYANEVEELPNHLRNECVVELKTLVTNVVCKYQKQANNAKTIH